jgi:integrase
MLCWIVRVALYSGMRAGEVKGLTRRQVNLDNRTVHVTETKNGVVAYWTVDP